MAGYKGQFVNEYNSFVVEVVGYGQLYSVTGVGLNRYTVKAYMGILTSVPTPLSD